MATNEASDGALPPLSAAASGRFVLPALDRRLSLSGCLGWAGAAPKPHAANSDADTAIKLLSEVVTWSVLVWFRRQKRDEKLGLRRPCFFLEVPWAVYSVLGAVGPRAAAAPVALPLEIGGSRL